MNYLIISYFTLMVLLFIKNKIFKAPLEVLWCYRAQRLSSNTKKQNKTKHTSQEAN